MHMDELKDGIGLQAYGQKDPVVQYRIEGFDMFDANGCRYQIRCCKNTYECKKKRGSTS